MNSKLLAFAIDPSQIMVEMGKPPDLWQKKFLSISKENIILNCCRQSGKSTIAGVKAAHKICFSENSTVIIISKSQRQAGETLRKVLDAYYAMGAPVPIRHQSALYLELENNSRAVSLPGKEGTIRGYSSVDTIIVDEASRVPDDIYHAVRPMLAVSQGQLCLLSTPFGQRGFFYQEWLSQDNWYKIKVGASECPRISKAFLSAELASLGRSMYEQEYFNSFTSVEGLVYPDFEKCIIDIWPFPEGVAYGGIDWGWRNPFGAVWGILDSSDVLWIKDERYKRNTPLFEHRDSLAKLRCNWAADPAGATEIQEFRIADIKVRRGNNDIKAGIAAVTARIETGRLKVMKNCKNLISESQLYRYPGKRDFQADSEKPIDDNNHCIGALRYLVSMVDSRFMAEFRRRVKFENNPDFPQEQKRIRENVWHKLRNPSWQWKVVG